MEVLPGSLLDVLRQEMLSEEQARMIYAQGPANKTGTGTSRGLFFGHLSAVLLGASPRFVRETDKDVGLNPLFVLVPDGTNPQIAFLNTKRGLRLGQLDVCLP